MYFFFNYCIPSIKLNYGSRDIHEPRLTRAAASVQTTASEIPKRNFYPRIFALVVEEQHALPWTSTAANRISGC